MTQQPYQSIRFEWLTAADSHSYIDFDLGDTRTTYPLPYSLGTSSVETLNCAIGMSLFRATIRLTPEALGQSIATAEISVDLKEPTLQAQIMRVDG